MPHLRGTVSMARAADDNSANSQFFILFLPRMQLDKKYTVFGRVIEGMQYVDTITPGEPPANPSTILQASIESDGKPPVAAPPPSPAPSIVAPAPAPAKKAAPKKR
jgi:cyclophilin family peptidyl-prolyl cis-trans isomerase